VRGLLQRGRVFDGRENTRNILQGSIRSRRVSGL
jgi:hypothetical protein